MTSDKTRDVTDKVLGKGKPGHTILGTIPQNSRLLSDRLQDFSGVCGTTYLFLLLLLFQSSRVSLGDGRRYPNGLVQRFASAVKCLVPTLQLQTGEEWSFLVLGLAVIFSAFSRCILATTEWSFHVFGQVVFVFILGLYKHVLGDLWARACGS